MLTKNAYQKPSLCLRAEQNSVEFRFFGFLRFFVFFRESGIFHTFSSV